MSRAEKAGKEEKRSDLWPDNTILNGFSDRFQTLLEQYFKKKRLRRLIRYETGEMLGWLDDFREKALFPKKKGFFEFWLPSTDSNRGLSG